MAFQKGHPGGPGRPKKADKHRGKIERAEKQIADRLPDLIDNLFRLATGVVIQEETEDGPQIYTTAPNFKANEYLINRIMGKPTERQELTTPDGLDINLTHNVAQQAVQMLNQWQQQIDNPVPPDPSSTLPVVLE